MAEADSSRIVIRNLPIHFVKDTTKLKSHLTAKVDDVTITDVYVPKAQHEKAAKVKAGSTRRLAFVGFKTSKEAKAVRDYFDKTFFGTTRVSVEFAKAKGEVGDKPWSKWSEGSKAYEKRMGKKGAGESDSKDAKEEAAKGPSAVDLQKNKLEKRKKEFLSVMTSRGSGKMWSNDDNTCGEEGEAGGEVGVPFDDGRGRGDDDTGDDEDDDEESAVGSDNDSDDEDYDVDPLAKAKPANELAVKGPKVESKPQTDDDFLASLKTNKADLESDSGDDSSSVASSSDDEDDDMEEEADPLPKSGQNIGGNNVTTDTSSVAAIEKSEADTDRAYSTTRLFLRNLPFSTTESALSAHLSSTAPPTLVHIPLDASSAPKGYAFATFASPLEATAVLDALDGRPFEGRLLHVLRARVLDAVDVPVDTSNMTYKQKREFEKKQAAGVKTGWNAAHVNQSAVVDSLADRLGVSKGEILDKDSDGMAVRLALGETKLIEENREYFASQGVKLDMSSVQSSTSTAAKDRSSTTILIKNLPYSTTAQDLTKLFSQHGSIARLLLPPSRTVGVVEFEQAVDARRAFKKCAFMKFGEAPLYLEWMPVGALTESEAKPDPSPSTRATMDVDDDAEDENTGAPAIAHTLFVKNLNFSTTEDGLSYFFSSVVDDSKAIRAVKIPNKAAPVGSKNEGSIQSLGYGFVEFGDAESAKKALSAANGEILDGHELQVKRSTKSLVAPVSTGIASDVKRTKLMVRNVPFEANRTELLQLFSNFGTLKKVRIPQKFDGTSRGFAFVDFVSHKEAASAKASLAQTHLYGRRLVIEWSEDKEDVGALRSKAKRDLDAANKVNKAKAKKGKHTVFD